MQRRRRSRSKSLRWASSCTAAAAEASLKPDLPVLSGGAEQPRSLARRCRLSRYLLNIRRVSQLWSRSWSIWRSWRWNSRTLMRHFDWPSMGDSPELKQKPKAFSRQLKWDSRHICLRSWLTNFPDEVLCSAATFPFSQISKSQHRADVGPVIHTLIESKTIYIC